MAILRSGSTAARRREWRAQTRLRAALERRLLVPLQRELARVGRAAADILPEGGLALVDLALRDHEAVLRGLYRAHYLAVAEAFGGRVLDSAKGIGIPEAKQDEPSEFLNAVLGQVEKIGARRVVQVAATTKRQITEALTMGLEEGEGQDAIARRIREKTEGAIGRARSQIIARTETHAASNMAEDEALSFLRLNDVSREWVAAQDLRTRASHAAADGQTRPQDESFDVGGVKLRYPGDPFGPPEEVINCRCVTAAVIED